MAGLRADILSPVKETGTLLGAITKAAAQQSGLREGTPVVMSISLNIKKSYLLH